MALAEIASQGKDISAAKSRLMELLLSDENQKVRESAAWALGGIASQGKDISAAKSRLMELLLSDENQKVRESAAWALVAMKIHNNF